MQQLEDDWAWLGQVPHITIHTADAGKALTVLVVHNGERWLGRTLVALARLDGQPGRIIAVDAGSTDDSRVLLDKAVLDGLISCVIDADPMAGFGSAANTAVERAVDDGFDPDFIWLLHDDSSPTSKALNELLLAAQEEDGAGRRPAIVVPKLLKPKRRNYPDRMSAVGESISGSGQRVPTTEPEDIDQHQQEPSAVLGGSTAGLLVAMDAWRSLGGLDPAIPLFRDGLDLGWRANAQGLSVRTCPAAALCHVEAGRSGIRESRLARETKNSDTALGMAVAVIHSRKPARRIAAIQIQSVLIALGYLLGKSPYLAAEQLRAAASLSHRKAELLAMAARRREQANSELPSGLLPPAGWGARRFFDRAAGRLSDYYYDLTTDEDRGGIDVLTSDEFVDDSPRRSVLGSPLATGFLLMLGQCGGGSAPLPHRQTGRCGAASCTSIFRPGVGDVG